MSLLGGVIITLYGIGLGVIFVYTLVQMHLVYNYWKSRRSHQPKKEFEWPATDEGMYPHVTVQLPVFNEKYVVERLIDAVVKFKWPTSKLEIQVLDDSTDETVEIISEKVAALQEQGFDIGHVRRDSREGFKAGALEYGQKKAKGEFIAIFDADFLPEADFLLKTVPYFEKEKIGLVQTRWGHVNRDYSLMTKVQAFALNAHFTVEQKGRKSAGYLMNFNGTAGIWRKACIRDAGGWHHDTLTEDLDLSYRAQMKGWKFEYLEDVVSPAELPVAVSALKTQQFRWTKGSAETARKHLGNVWKSNLPLLKKLHASSHLLSGSIYIFIFLISVLSVPLLWLKMTSPEADLFFHIFSVFSIGLLGWVLFYGSANLIEDEGWLKKGPRILFMFPVFLALSMGMSVHNSIAALKGYIREQSPFIRTPKFNVTKLTDSWKSNKYLVRSLSPVTIFEGLMTLYFFAGLILAVVMGDYGLFPFHLMLLFGFGSIFGYSLRERFLKIG